MERIAFYLGGESYPADRGIEMALETLYRARGWCFVSHAEIVEPAPVDSPQEAVSAALERLVPEPREDREIVLIGRSAGARTATRFALRRPITAVACLSYPFKNPRQVLDLTRIAHLAEIAVPTLIVQGETDEYGGLAITEDYLFSPAVQLHFVESGHGMDLTRPALAHVPRLLADFSAGGWRDPCFGGMRFDEAHYLALHQDVAAGVAAGRWASGETHYAEAGRRELRRYRLVRPKTRSKFLN